MSRIACINCKYHTKYFATVFDNYTHWLSSEDTCKVNPKIAFDPVSGEYPVYFKCADKNISGQCHDFTRKVSLWNRFTDELDKWTRDLQ